MRKCEKEKIVKIRGFTLIEGLIVLFVFSLMTLTFYSLYSLGMVRILDAQKRLQAMTLATEQMEKIRNLAYDDVGFSGSVPNCATHCVLSPTEQRTLGGEIFTLSTGIQYRDDPFDGTMAGATDVIPNDYKRVTVRVEWGELNSSERRVEMVSRFVPPGMEQGIPNTGALSINVYDYAGVAVQGARVDIAEIPGNFFTDSAGNLFLLGVPVHAGYSIQVTKSQYSMAQTLLLPPAGSFPPRYAPVAVEEGVVNVGNFEISPLSNVSFHFRDPFGNALSGVGFSVTGEKRLDNNNPTPVYEYSTASFTTNSGGDVSLDWVSGGGYVLDFTESEDDYVFWKTEFFSGNFPGEVVFPYGGYHTEHVYLLEKSVPGILVRARDASTGGVLSGATVRITDALGTYDETKTTDSNGLAYFSETENAIVSGVVYTVRTELSGYVSQEETVTPIELQEYVAEMSQI